MFLKASFDDKVKGFVPFEAGRKVPIHERVQYYMNKLTQEEQESLKQVPEKKALVKKETIGKNITQESYEDLAALTDHDMSMSEQKFNSNSPKRPIMLPPLMSNSNSQIEDSPQRIGSNTTRHHNVTKKFFGKREQLLSKELEPISVSKQSLNSTLRDSGPMVNI